MSRGTVKASKCRAVLVASTKPGRVDGARWAQVERFGGIMQLDLFLSESDLPKAKTKSKKKRTVKKRKPVKPLENVGHCILCKTKSNKLDCDLCPACYEEYYSDAAIAELDRDLVERCFAVVKPCAKCSSSLNSVDLYNHPTLNPGHFALDLLCNDCKERLDATY